jgi:hypothetical protein
VNTRKRRRLTRRKPGRPKGPPTVPVFVRFPQGEYEALDKWTEAHVETMTLPQAVRRRSNAAFAGPARRYLETNYVS